MACFALVGPPLAACLLRRSTRHVASDALHQTKTEMRPPSPACGLLLRNAGATLFAAIPCRLFEQGIDFVLVMPVLVVDLAIGAEKLAAYYRGEARTVRARATNGQTVQFPTSILQKHISKDGIHGRFQLEFDEQNKFVGLHRLADG
jgi:hypothetical protein